MIKRLLPLLLLCACAGFAQTAPAHEVVIDCSANSYGACTNHAATKSEPAPQVEKSHNFFNWKNSTVFGIQAGGAVWYARERNGTLSNVTNRLYWERTQYLKNAYLQAGFFALAADGAAYAIHKSGNGWKRHLAEHLIIDGSTAALYIFANRNRHEYNTQECRFGEKEFCSR